jgi:hypothetical protein
MKNKLDYLH